MIGWIALRVTDDVHTRWSGPATAGDGGSTLNTLRVSVLGAQTPFATDHTNVLDPGWSPAAEAVALEADERITEAGPDQFPFPTAGGWAGIPAVSEQTVKSGAATAADGGRSR